jgi:hypothetical protein
MLTALRSWRWAIRPSLAQTWLSLRQSNFMAWRMTGDPKYQERAYAVLRSLKRYTRTWAGGYVRCRALSPSTICGDRLTVFPRRRPLDAFAHHRQHAELLLRRAAQVRCPLRFPLLTSEATQVPLFDLQRPGSHLARSLHLQHGYARLMASPDRSDAVRTEAHPFVLP